MSVEVTLTRNKHVSVEVVGMGNHVTVELLLWFAKEAQEAIGKGLDPKTEVRIDGTRISARNTRVEEIP